MKELFLYHFGLDYEFSFDIFAYSYDEAVSMLLKCLSEEYEIEYTEANLDRCNVTKHRVEHGIIDTEFEKRLPLD